MRTCLNLGCGKQSKPSTEDETWINVDKFKLPGVDVQWNLFKVPYPWEDNSIDHIHCSHFLEHIPHTFIPYNTPATPEETWKEHLLSLDGFFAFFEECYRILKPQGTISIFGPYGWTNGAIADPTHTRLLCAASFSYLHTEKENSDFDYGLKCDFTLNNIKSVSLEMIPNAIDGLGNFAYDSTVHKSEFVVEHFLNVTRHIMVEMHAIK